MSNLGHSIQYLLNWGDGANSGWLPVGTTSASHSWTSAGTYLVKAQARCATHTSIVSPWSSPLTVSVNNFQFQGATVDFNGDWKTDVAIYRASTGYWWILPSGSSPHYSIGWGGDASDKAVIMNPASYM